MSVESFDQLKAIAKNPGNVTYAEWKTGLAVAETLFAEGKPIGRVEDSVIAPKESVPNKYDLGDSTTAEHMPHWGYVVLQKGKQRELFSLESSKLSTDKVVGRVKDKIQEVKKGHK